MKLVQTHTRSKAGGLDMRLVAERVVVLELAIESLVDAFEAVDSPPIHLQQDVPALYRRLQVELSRAARLARGNCHCLRFGLGDCMCVEGSVQ